MSPNWRDRTWNASEAAARMRCSPGRFNCTVISPRTPMVPSALDRRPETWVRFRSINCWIPSNIMIQGVEPSKTNERLEFRYLSPEQEVEVSACRKPSAEHTGNRLIFHMWRWPKGLGQNHMVLNQRQVIPSGGRAFIRKSRRNKSISCLPKIAIAGT